MKFCIKILVPFLILNFSLVGQSFEDVKTRIDNSVNNINDQVIEWRRDLHQHPELSNMEFRTSGIVAKHLENLGFDVRTGIAGTGVVGILKYDNPGPVVAIRADMDALPVTEELDLPFASKVKVTVDGVETGVMHACGHDVHTAILMGAASVFSDLKEDLPGAVMLIFQPSEEGVKGVDSWGAKLMLEEGVFSENKPDIILGLHTWPKHVGSFNYRAGPMMASVDNFDIIVKGKGSHGAMPWNGIDPVVISSQIVLGLQTIVGRQVNLPEGSAVITVGSIHGGNRFNIIPDKVRLEGTIRTHNEESRVLIHERLKSIAEGIAEGSGGSAEVTIQKLYPAVDNDYRLTEYLIPVLKKEFGSDMVNITPPVMISEDFSYFQKEIPGLYFFLGIAPPGSDLSTVEPNHSPRFFVDEDALNYGIRSFAYLTSFYLINPLED